MKERCKLWRRWSNHWTGSSGPSSNRRCVGPETYAYLDRLKGKSEELPVSVAVREAVVQSEGIRRHPELVQGEGQRAGVLRGLLLVWSVLIAQAGAAGQQAVSAFGQAVRYAGKASSCVEGLNSVVRMQQSRHRKMSQGLLDLKRLYWNLRKFRTGGRKKTSPYERLGCPCQRTSPGGSCSNSRPSSYVRFCPRSRWLHEKVPSSRNAKMPGWKFSLAGLFVPTITVLGKPGDTSTSTPTGRASIPTRAKALSLASIGDGPPTLLPVFDPMPSNRERAAPHCG